MKDLLQYLVSEMVEKPECISIAEKEKDDRIIYELVVDPSDIGRVIGRGGCVAKDLRTLIKASCTTGQKVTVDIIND